MSQIDINVAGGCVTGVDILHGDTVHTFGPVYLTRLVDFLGVTVFLAQIKGIGVGRGVGEYPDRYGVGVAACAFRGEGGGDVVGVTAAAE